MNRYNSCADMRLLVTDQEEPREEEQPGKRKRKACIWQQSLVSVHEKKTKRSATNHSALKDGLAGEPELAGGNCWATWAPQEDRKDSPAIREQMASNHHAQVKDFISIHQADGVGTSFASTNIALGVNDTIMHMDKCIFEEEANTPTSCINSATAENGHPLLFIYDCETTGGNHLQDHIMEIGSLVLIPNGVSISTVEFTSLCQTSRQIAHRVSQKCGITAHDLLNQPLFDSVFERFIRWIRICVTEACQSGIPYYPVLVAHNGFAFDFIFLVAEVKRCKLDEIFEGIHIYFADTLYDTRRLVKNAHQLFAKWSPQEKKRLGLEELFKKCFPGKTYNAHRALEDTRALAQIFSFLPLEPLLTIRSKDQIVAHWTEKHQELAIKQPYTIHFGQSCTKPMALCLHRLGLSYDKLKSAFDDNMDNSQAFHDHLRRAGLSSKAWREKIWKHFQLSAIF